MEAESGHNTRNNIVSVSETIWRRENFRHRATEGKPNSIKVAWMTSSLVVEHESSKNRKEHALIEHLKLYCENSSLTGYKYITEIHRTWFERLMWISLHIIMISTLGVIIWNVLQDYKNKPVVTVVDSDHYPSNLLDFPGISVCSINRISQRAAMNFAQQIYALNITKLSVDKILSLLHNLGNLYESSVTRGHNENELEDLLNVYFNGNYQLTELMKELTPKCSDIILKCRYRTSFRNCSKTFSFRKTQDGYCCLFNYVHEYEDLHVNSKETTKNNMNDPLKIEKLSLMNSLTFLIEPFLDDYFFSILPLTGWKIMIFNPSDYPDNTSGGVTETLIAPGTENFLELNAVSFFTEKAVRRFDVYDRKCIFKDEISALHDAYTYSDCIVDCKVKDIWKTCGCQPFFYPTRNTHRICNITDIQCLNKFKLKWWSVMPHYMDPESEESKAFDLISNKSWSLRCQNCYPSCNDVRYFLQTSSVSLRNNTGTLLLKDVNIVNQSLVHIFFTKYGTLRLKQDIAYYWYELLSDIGGLCGIFIGFSLISAVELIYFLVLSSASLCRNIGKMRSKSDNVTSTTSHNLRPLYWTELAPLTNLKMHKRKIEG